MQENIDVTVTLKNALSRPARQAKESVEDLGDEVRELNTELGESEKASADVEAQTKKTTKATKESTKATKASAKVTAEDRLQKEAVARAAREAKAAQAAHTLEVTRGSRALKTLQGVLKGTMKAFKGFTMVLKVAGIIGAVTGAIGLLTASLSALGAASYAAIAGLTPMFGLFGALPGVIGGLVLTLVAAKMGFSGVGDALKALTSGDASPAELAEQMNKLTGAGRVLATTLAEFSKGPLQDMKDATQKAMAPQFTAAVTIVGNKLMPMLTRQVSKAGSVLGDLALHAAAVTSQPFFRGEFAKTTSSGIKFFESGGKAATSMLTAMLGIGVAFAPILRQMGKGMEASAADISARVHAGLGTGGLQEFFQKAWDTARGVWGAMKDIGVILHQIGSAGMDVADRMGANFGDMLDRVRTFFDSATGQQSLTTWFEQSLPIMSAFGRLLAGLTESLQIFIQSSPDVVRVIDALAGGLPVVATVMGSIATASADLIETIVELAGTIISDLTPGFADTVSTITASLIPALHALVPPLTDIVGAALSVLGSMSPVFTALGALAPLVQTVAYAAEAMAAAFEALPSPLRAAAAAATVLWVALKFFGTSMIARGITAVGTALGTAALGLTSRAMGAATGMGAATAAGGKMKVGALGWTVAIVAFAAVLGKAAAANDELMDSLARAADNPLGPDLGAASGQLDALSDKWDENLSYSEKVKDNWSSFDIDLGQAKNTLEGVFGQSDLEEGRAELEKIQAAADNLAPVMYDLASAFGKNIGPIDGSEASMRELDALMGAAQPTMDALRFTVDDLALAQRVASGDATVFERALAASKPTISEMIGMIRESVGGFTDSSAAVGTTAAPLLAYKANQAAAAREARGLATATRQVVTEITALDELLVSRQRTLIGFKQQLADTNAVLKEGKKTLDLNTQAGRDNKSSLLDLAEAANAIIDDGERKKAMVEATDRIYKFGIRAGWSEERSRNFADGLFDLGNEAKKVPKNVETRVTTPGLGPAREGVESYRTLLTNIPEDVFTTVHKTFVTDGGDFVGGGPQQPGSIDVSPPVPGNPRKRSASGNYIAAGESSLVNELGPELLVPRIGSPYVIGDGTQQVATFSEPGYIVPAIGTPASVAKTVPAWARDRVESEAPAWSAEPPSRGGGGSSAHGGGAGTAVLPVPDISINLHGSNLTTADVEQAAIAAWRKYEREMKERR